MKTSPHQQAIVVFGIVAPMFLIVAVSAATFVGNSKLQETHQAKVATLQRFNGARAQASELEAFLAKDQRREQVAYWNSKLSQDVVEAFNQNLDQILAKYDSDVLRLTEMGQAGGLGKIAADTKLPRTRMKLSFEGGFKPMQLLLAELETEMPQLILEELTVAPIAAASGSKHGRLKFSVVYHCWEKSKSSPVKP